MARYAWKWEKIGKIQKAISCGRPAEFASLVILLCISRGCRFQATGNAKKNAEHDTKNIR